MKKTCLGIALVVLAMVGCVGMVQGVGAVDKEKNVCTDDEIDDELKELAGCTLGNKTAMDTAQALINVALSVVGILAVGVIVYGGYTYITSTGDAAKTTKAKHIITYGVVGLIIALLAAVIVQFVSRSLG